MKKKIVFIQGAYDLINWGHVKSFELCKSFGDYLIVALNTNELLEAYKKRQAILPWYQKKEIIESMKFVDEVVEAPDFSPMELLKKHDVDVYVLTEEWKETKSEEIAYMLAKGGEVKFSPRFEGVVCTSEIKRRLLEEARSEIRSVSGDEFVASPTPGHRKLVWD